jgi:hypothetical protein
VTNLSNLSFDELFERYVQEKKWVKAGEKSAELEALTAEWQKRTERIRKVVEYVYQVALNLRNAWEARILIQQYEKEIQRVETLLKYTRHSKKRRKYEQYLKWLHEQVAELSRKKG